MIYVGIDDTNNSESVGTGKFTRHVADEISKIYPVYGVTRHQFYVHPDIDYSIHNFCAVIHVNTGKEHVNTVFDIAQQKIKSDFNMGSNPGLAVADESQISPAVVIYGKDAKEKVLTQRCARIIAKNSNIKLSGFGQNKNGVIGALAGVGLAFTKNDGRFIQLDKLRSIKEPSSVNHFINSGIDRIFTLEGTEIKDGTVFNEDNKPVKPSLINGEVVLFVKQENGLFRAINKD